MRHRIKSGKIGSFNPERVEVPEELQEEQALSSEVEEIFEEDTAFSDSDETLAAMELYGRRSSRPLCVRSIEDAMERVYNSSLMTALQDEENELYVQSPAYLYELLNQQPSHGDWHLG